MAKKIPNQYVKTVEITITAKDKDDARNRFNFIIGQIQNKAKIRIVKSNGNV